MPARTSVAVVEKVKARLDQLREVVSARHPLRGPSRTRAVHPRVDQRGQVPLDPRRHPGRVSRR
jgi:hypothetical protein